MDGMAALGIILIIYGILVLGIAYQKPQSIWRMKKILWFIKVLGEKGTVVFFDVWGVAAIGLGVWLILG